MWSIRKVGAVGSSGRATAIRVYPESRRAPIFVRPASDSARFHSHPPIANFAKLNRQTPEVEHLASHRKQTPAICSNRQKITFSRDEYSSLSTAQIYSFRAASPARAFACATDLAAANVIFRPFLTETGAQTELPVSNSKQTSGTFLTETRIACLLVLSRLPEGRALLRGSRLATRGARAAAAAQAVTKSVRFVSGLSEKSTAQNHSFRAGSPARAFARALNLAAALLFLMLRPAASFAAAPPVHQQAANPVLDTTICEITSHPLDFEGKMVRVKARIATLFKSRVIEDATQPCSRVMRLTYSTEPAPASSFVPGPDTPAKDLPRPTLIDDDQFKLFQKYLAARMYATSEGAPCSPCDRYEITATLTGMVNFPVSAKPDSKPRNPRERLFFLQSVADVTPRDISATYDPKKFSTEPLAFSRGFVSGRLLGPDGKPLPQTDVQIVSTESVPASIKGTHQLTDDQGQFNFEVAPGQYVVAINLYTGPSKELPYSTTYLPGTTNVISATMIQVQAGQHVEHLTLQLSAAQRLRERKFSGKVEWPDGRAATDVAVWLNEDEHHQLLMKGPAGRTNAAGNFTLIGFEGRDYFLHANVTLAGKPVCAKKLRLNSAAPLDAIDLKLSVAGQIPCLKE